LHAGAEGAALHGNSLSAKRVAERLVEPLGGHRRGRAAEARAIPLARVRDERELADYERFAADFEEAPVELPFLVLEDAQARYLAGQPRRGRLVIPLGDAQEDAEAGADGADRLPCDEDARLADSLDDRSQLSSASSAR
jgi:hypothetical protein